MSTVKRCKLGKNTKQFYVTLTLTLSGALSTAQLHRHTCTPCVPTSGCPRLVAESKAHIKPFIIHYLYSSARVFSTYKLLILQKLTFYNDMQYTWHPLPQLWPAFLFHHLTGRNLFSNKFSSYCILVLRTCWLL